MSFHDFIENRSYASISLRYYEKKVNAMLPVYDILM